MPKLKKGMWVKVYENPLTSEKLEGVAKLITYHFTAQGMEYWVVAFPDDPSFFVDRIINPETASE